MASRCGAVTSHDDTTPIWASGVTWLIHSQHSLCLLTLMHPGWDQQLAEVEWHVCLMYDHCHVTHTTLPTNTSHETKHLQHGPAHVHFPVSHPSTAKIMIEESFTCCSVYYDFWGTVNTGEFLPLCLHSISTLTDTCK